MKSILPILLAGALVAPPAAAAETVAADPDARQVTALGGTVVWVSGQSPAKLMQRTADGTISPVPGAGERAAYRNPDLGRNAQGELVLTYARCSTLTKCTYVRDDLAGSATAFKGLAPKQCALSATPAVWRASVAYALSCFERKGGKKVVDAARSGLYLKKGGRTPVRFTAPREARRAGALSITDVDLRGSQIAAVYEDVAAFAVVQSTSGSLRKVKRVASSEGDGDQRAAGVTIGTGDVRLWSLTRGSYAGDPATTIIQRIARTCDDFQTLTAPEGPNRESDHPLVDLSADGATVYAVDPGVGIVTHAYQAGAAC